jgi:hypothetical protein
MTLPFPDARPVTQRPLRDLVDKLVEKATSLVNGPPAAETSGWYAHTGEGQAMSAGSTELEHVDVDKILGNQFRAAFNAIQSVNGRPDMGHTARFDAVQSTFEANLREPDAGK